MIHDKCRLNQFFFTIFFEEEVDDIALCMTILKFDVMLFCKSLCFFISSNCIKIDTSILLDCIIHCKTLKWLAEINLINGDETAALKYLNLLEDEPGCKQWVKDRRPGTQSREFISFMEQMRRFTPKSDMVHTASRTPETLRCLIESNPANIPAREYLLCYDLLTKDLGSFMNDYAPGIKESRLYQEAILIYLASNNALTSQNTGRFNIPDSLVEEFVEYTNTFVQNGGAIAKMSKYRRTYWYYFHYATRNENRK